MIEIRKHGKPGRRFRTRYLTGCKKCGCEFWFDKNDYEGINGIFVAIKCPECGNAMTGICLGDIAWVAEQIEEETKP